MTEPSASHESFGAASQGSLQDGATSWDDGTDLDAPGGSRSAGSVLQSGETALPDTDQDGSLASAETRPLSGGPGETAHSAGLAETASTVPDTAGGGGTASRSAPHPTTVRNRIGLYQVTSELGRGGMGTVYRAWHPVRREYVALKVIRPDVVSGRRYDQLRELFLREAGILTSLRHPNIVGCFDANEVSLDGRPLLYMALELLEGESLEERLEGEPLPLRAALEIAGTMASALEALHTHEPQILHRDLKPANVFLTRAGSVKLLDFGLAGIRDWKLSHLSVFAAGSRPYMAPEQFDGLRHCTERSDLYSLGVTLFRMLTGRAPFQAQTDTAYRRAHRDQSPPLIASVRPELAGDPLAEPLQHIVTRLLAKRPEERYDSARSLSEALTRAATGGTITQPKVTRPETLRRRRRLVRGAGVVAVLALVGVVSVWLARSRLPQRLAAVERLVAAKRFGEAEGAVRRLLADAPDNQAVQALAASVQDGQRRRSDLSARRQAARELRDGGDLVASAEAFAALARDARRAGVLAPAELERWGREAHDVAEARRAAGDEARAAVAALLATGDLARAEGAVATARRLSVGPAEAEGAESLARQLTARRAAGDRQREVEAGERALDGGALAQARAHLERARSPGEGRTPAIVARATSLADSIATAGALRELAASARRLRDGGDLSRALTVTRSALAALKDRGPILARRAAVDEADLRALERALRADAALAAVEASWRRGDTRGALRLAEVARAQIPVDDAPRRSRLAALEARAQRVAFQAALAEARRLVRDPRRAAEGGRAAGRALRALPVDEAASFARAALRFEEDRRHRGPVEARRQLRETLRALPSAEPAWLALEEAAARGAIRPEERLIPRFERVTLGSEDPSAKNPTHLVSLAPFYVESVEVTAGRLASNRTAPNAAARTLPAIGVTFAEAVAFARRAGKRLLTADEWEVAASVDPRLGGARRSVYPWGDSWRPEAAGTGARGLRPVGANRLDESAWGVLDLGGSVQEWTSERGADDRIVPVLQGGSYLLLRFPKEFRAAARCRPLAGEGLDRFPDAGVRLGRDVPPPSLASFVASPRLGAEPDGGGG